MEQKKILLHYLCFFSLFIAIIWFGTKSEASSYIIETSHNNSSTNLIQNVSGMNSTNTAIQINASSNDTAYFKYKYTGLKERAFYVISAYVKINSFSSASSDYQHGVMIRISESPASSEIIQNETEWKKINLVALSGIDGTLNVQFMLNDSLGDVLFDNIEIKEINNDSNFEYLTYTNSKGKTARIVFYKNDLNNITTTEINNWLAVLLEIRECLTDVTGVDVDDGNIDIIATNYYGAVAYVIGGRTEIQWMKNCVDLDAFHSDFQNGADTPFFITHEIGHQHTAPEVNFDGEYWGTTLGLIADYKLNLNISGLNIDDEYSIRQEKAIIDYCYHSYQNNFLRGDFSGDGLTYITFQTILKLNSYKENLGWDSLKETLNYLKDAGALSNNGETFEMFILKWAEFSGYDVKSLFFSNSSYDESILNDNFKIGKFDYSINSDGRTITVNNFVRNWDEVIQDTFELVVPSTINGYIVTEIGRRSFFENNNLKKVTLPNTLLILNEVAFYHCSNLEEVIIPKDSQLTTIKSWVFTYSKLKKIFIPKTVTTIETPALDTIRKGIIIEGYTNTQAENYATENELIFKALNLIMLNKVDGEGGSKYLFIGEQGIYLDKDFKYKIDFLTDDAINSIDLPQKIGYHFLGYYKGDNLVISERGYVAVSLDSLSEVLGDSAELIALWEPNTDTKYKVEHYKQKPDGTYNLIADETDYLSGTTGETKKAEAKTYEGYTEDIENSSRVANGEIIGDGSLTLKLYYMANTDTKYKVEHYKQKLDGTYNLIADETDYLSGTTGEIKKAEAKTYEGYTEDIENSSRVASGEIIGDGSLTLKLYYMKNKDIKYEEEEPKQTIDTNKKYEVEKSKQLLNENYATKILPNTGKSYIKILIFSLSMIIVLIFIKNTRNLNKN